MRIIICLIFTSLTLALFSCSNSYVIKEDEIYKRVELYENSILTKVENYDKQGKMIETIGYNNNQSIIWRIIYKYDEKGQKIKSISFDKDNIYSGETEYIYEERKELGYISTNKDGDKLKFIKSYNNDNLIASYFLNSEDKIGTFTTYTYDSIDKTIEENEFSVSYNSLENGFPSIRTQPWTTKKIFLDTTGKILKTHFREFYGLSYPSKEVYYNYDQNGYMIESISFENISILKKKFKLSSHYAYTYSNNTLIKRTDLLKYDSTIYTKKVKLLKK